jgi:hypothetical protein
MSTLINIFCGTAFLEIFGFFKEQSKHYKRLQR